MKIWITRQSAGSVRAGGLERLDVWFQKPVWVEGKYYFDLPFSGPESGFHSSEHWEVREGGVITTSLSFGKLFGYTTGDDEEKNVIAKYVWEKLRSHFNNRPFDEWWDMEETGSAKVQDFFLEIDLSIKMKE